MRRGATTPPDVWEQPELGCDSDGHRRFLKAPFPLTVDLLEEEFAGLSAVDLGRALRLAAVWWRDGEVPSARALFLLLSVEGAKARQVHAKLTPRFAPGTPLAQLREREIAKARRRLKLDAPPKPNAVVLPFPGCGAKV